MRDEFTFRSGKPEDYPAFMAAEAKAWRGSGVPLITEEQYNTWLEVFPQGLVLAEYRDRICAHHFAQIARFDVFDLHDNRDWDTLTDFGFCRRTHDPEGNVLYGVSLSSCVRGGGRAVFRHAMRQVSILGLERYVGACRIPGLSAYATTRHRTMSQVAAEYASRVLAGERKDPTLSPLLEVEGLRFHRVIPGYFHDPQSGDWACLISYRPR